ncbi:hydrolase-like protein [Phialemonium atrogriseum]|uniref:Hydrolase-like protein n=1 Tax=Phialemonium atrogriseum TaxID=1093897 RepID=A0AAJ0C3Q8_9PEZI|nr:hydrolase-like protein [Phialemonium atrogriseum]KAK1767076.1 hydrolase-like protein [Phialemonium atrogriseum]
MSSEPAAESPVTPSFEGRLKLHEFMFQDGTAPLGSSTNGAIRRSSRLTTPSAAGASRSLVLTPEVSTNRTLTLSKRKAVAGSGDISELGIASPASSPSPLKRQRSNGNGNGSGNNSSGSSPSRSGSLGRGRGRGKSGYAPPSTYAHLSQLPDAMAPNMLVLFVGLNPGIETARQQHAYAHPSNLFWKLLASSGVTPRLCAASEDRSMPRLYGLGLTNIVSRPSRNGAELSKAEMDAGVCVLEEKARRWRPEVVCVVGKGIWESVWRVRHGRPIGKADFKYGWQDEAENMGVVGEAGQKDEEKEDGVEYRDDWKGARVFVATSTSGLAATLRPAEKEVIWRELGEWVETRRKEKTAAVTSSS